MNQEININQLAAEIDARLQALPNRDTGTIRDLRREYTKRVAKAPASFVIALALRLLDYPTFDQRFVAYELIHFHRPALRSLGVNGLEQLGRGLDSWYSVDTFAPYLLGPAWREGQIGDDFIHQWAHSEDRWQRRAALVATVALNSKARGGRGDVARTLAVCRLLVNDRDDMVVKAMSWALREIVPYDPAAARAFLSEHEAVLAARVKREVGNKLATGLKNPKRDKNSE